ncbi:hypothetical protein HDU92_004900 [Lobulomyces angularis]|nr:hypothetical protein HDU92_004900 [Lobulomyces angularis]
MDPSVSALLTSVITNFIIVAIIYGLFFLIRKQPFAKRVYNAIIIRNVENVNKNEELLKVNGVDSYLYIKYLENGVRIFLPVTVVSLIVLLPVNIVNQRNLPGLNLLTIGDILDQQRIWAHAVVSILITLYTLHLVHNMFKEYQKLRIEFLKDSSSTILIEDIHKNIRNESTLGERLNEYPGSVNSISFYRPAKELGKLVAKRSELIAKVEKLCYKEPDESKPPQHRTIPIIGNKVDSIQHHSKEFFKLTEKIEHEKDLVKNKENSSAAFVTFDEPVLAHSAMQHKYKDFKPLWLSSGNIQDVYWPNIGVSKAKRLLFSFVGTLMVIALCLFWFTIIAFIGSITTLDSLVHFLPFLKPVTEMSPVVTGFVKGFLPPLAVAIFISFLPSYLIMITKFQKVSSYSLIYYDVQQKYYWFQVVTVFLATVLSTGLLSELQNFVKNPGSIVQLLGIAIPASSTFFITYVLLRGFIAPALELLQINQIILKFVSAKFLSKTPRDFAKLYLPPEFNFGTRYPPHSMMYLFGFVFSVMAPIILIPVTLYFVIVTYIYRNQLSNVYRVTVDTGGIYFRRAMWHLLIALLLFQATMVTMFFLKLATVQAVLALLTLLFTVINLLYFNIKFGHKKSTYMKKLETRREPHEIHHHDRNIVTKYEKVRSYVQPSLHSQPPYIWTKKSNWCVNKFMWHGFEVSDKHPEVLQEKDDAHQDILYNPFSGRGYTDDDYDNLKGETNHYEM